MKKLLIPAALILAISLVPCVGAPAGLTDATGSATAVFASDLFWRLIDAFRTCELARFAKTDPNQLPEPVSAAASLLAPAIVDLAIEHSIAFAHNPSAPQNSCPTMSISACAVRRIVEREIRTLREESAGPQSSRPDHNSNHDTDTDKEKS